MANKSMLNQGNSLQSQIEIDLVQAHLDAEGIVIHPSETVERMIQDQEIPTAKISYPWNPADPEAEVFFNELEQQFSLEDLWQPEELAQRSQAFFSRIDELWNEVSLERTLAQQFSAYIPQDILAKIAQKAQQVVSSSVSLRDQLVQCAQEICLNLAIEDLQTLARPYAFEMRSIERDEVKGHWQDLSEFQQARMALAIARYAIHELQK
ncbi:MAG: hypothetical protein KME16_23325 [Scytolyngbya sp. HA4215-MV1]|jgi:hypothetical protein|nr:hypothetical protein [Scytolyngbya sp. HA4215-MV1]